VPFSREIPARGGVLIAVSEIDVTRDIFCCDVVEFRGGRTPIARRAIVNHGREGSLEREEGLGGTERKRRALCIYMLPHTLGSFSEKPHDSPPVHIQEYINQMPPSALCMFV